MTDVLAGPTPYQMAILRGLNRYNKHIYEGTVSEKTAAARHAKNKRARVARRKNR